MENHKPQNAGPTANRAPANLDLHIQSIVLDGLTGVRSGEIQHIVQRELTRVVRERGVPATMAMGGEIALLDGGEFHVAPRADAQTVGTQIAHAIYRGLIL